MGHITQGSYNQSEEKFSSAHYDLEEKPLAGLLSDDNNARVTGKVWMQVGSCSRPLFNSGCLLFRVMMGSNKK